MNPLKEKVGQFLLPKFYEVRKISLSFSSHLSGLRLDRKLFYPKIFYAIACIKSLRIKNLLRKEVIQPQVPLRLPCYDFTPVTNPTFVGGALSVRLTAFWLSQLPWCDGRCVQGPGTYSPRRADPRLLAIPTSWSRVADSNPN